MTFDEIIENRQSNRKFDPEVPVPAAVMEKALHHATLAPNSSNMQCWSFHWMRSEDMKNATRIACLNQMAARSAQELVVFATRRDQWRKRLKWHLDWIDKDAERLGDPNARSIRLRRKYYAQLIPLSYFNDGLGIMGVVRRLLSFSIGLVRPMVRGEGYAGQRITVHKSCALAAQNFMMSITAQGFDSCPMEGFDEKRLKKLLGLPYQAEINMVIAVGKGTKEGLWGPRRRVDASEVIKVH